MQETFKTYRDVIRYEYESRHTRNPAYSMRAFARDLQISPSRLSEIFTGKQGLSPARAKIIGQKIGYQGRKLNWFCNLVEAESGRSPIAKASAKRKLTGAKNGVISEPIGGADVPLTLHWYHFAIRRMTAMRGFDGTPEWIANKLGVAVGKIDQAMAEMLEMGLLKRDESGRVTTDFNVHFHSDVVNRERARRTFRSMLAKAYMSKSFPIERRHHGLHFFTIDKEQLSELKELIQEFEDKVDNLTYKAKRNDELVALVDVFFPLTTD